MRKLVIYMLLALSATLCATEYTLDTTDNGDGTYSAVLTDLGSGVYRWEFVSDNLWTPNNIIDDVLAWYDASLTNTITESAGAVSQWDDLSTNGYDLAQGTGANQPSTGTRTIGTLNALDFDGTNHFMNTADFSWTNAAAIAVISTDYATTFPTYNGILTGKTSPICFIGYSGRDTFYTATPYANYRVDSELTVTLSPLNSAHIIWGVDATPATESTGLQVGQDRGTTSRRFNGLISEAIVFEAEPSESTRQKLEGYLAWKWGLEGNLPTNHPHKASAPTQ